MYHRVEIRDFLDPNCIKSELIDTRLIIPIASSFVMNSYFLVNRTHCTRTCTHTHMGSCHEINSHKSTPAKLTLLRSILMKSTSHEINSHEINSDPLCHVYLKYAYIIIRQLFYHQWSMCLVKLPLLL